jgi:hypothetical protein
MLWFGSRRMKRCAALSREAGPRRAREFNWDKAARETLQVLVDATEPRA